MSLQQPGAQESKRVQQLSQVSFPTASLEPKVPRMCSQSFAKQQWGDPNVDPGISQVESHLPERLGWGLDGRVSGSYQQGPCIWLWGWIRAHDRDPVFCGKSTEMWDPTLRGVRSSGTEGNSVDPEPGGLGLCPTPGACWLCDLGQVKCEASVSIWASLEWEWLRSFVNIKLNYIKLLSI